MSKQAVLPNFFIIGAAKSGTSALHHYLNQHPDVFMSSVKEPHFFSYAEKAEFSRGPGDSQRMHDAISTLDEYLALFAGAGGKKAIGESSTTYLDSAEAPRRIAELVPQARHIAVLRSPVERAYASFMHLRRDGAEPCKDFRSGLAQEDSRLQQRWSYLWHYRTRQYSFEKLRRYFDLFGRDHMRVYLYEDLKRDDVKVVRDIFRFLEIDDQVTIDTSARHNVGGVPKNEMLHSVITHKSTARSMLRRALGGGLSRLIKSKLKSINLERPEIPEDVRHELIAAYREDILRLQDLIGRDLSAWLEPV